MTTLTEELVDYAQQAFHTPFPDNLIKVAKNAIIDQIGLQIGGSEFPWSKNIRDYLMQHSTKLGVCTITKYGDKISLVDAAFINSCFAHAQDFDDSHQEAQTHPGSVVIPVAIAVGEYLNLSGNTVTNAIIIGMEVMLRLAHSICPACIEGGHHTPPTVGPFGAALAAGLLLGLDKNQLINALGICGSYAGGLVEYTLSGGSVKRIHTGLGARAGLEAALLAKAGITGPSTIIEGKKGIWTVFGRDKVFKERLLNNIGQSFLLSTLMFKLYNCCYLINPAIEGLLTICKNHEVTANDIKSIIVGFSDFSISHAGKIQIPHDALGAQFSTSFTLALSLIDAVPSLNSYSKTHLTNPKIISLAKKITILPDETANQEFPVKNGCIITVETNSGKKYSLRIRDPKGSPENLLTTEEIKHKFFANTVPTIGSKNAKAIYETLSVFDTLPSVSQIHSIYLSSLPI